MGGLKKFNFSILLSVMMLAPLAATPVAAQETIPQMLVNGCGDEIKKFCKKVTPGQGRVAACLYSYGDKISMNCTFAVYDATDKLNQTMAALSHIARKTSCRSDLASYCKGVRPGGGRLYNCIRKNKATLTDGCRAALPKAEMMLRDVGVIKK